MPAEPSIFLPTLFDALAVGSVYALIALGYTMVYGILKFINFAHSDIFVLGAWVSYSVALVGGFADADGAAAGVQAGPVAAWVLWGGAAVALAAIVTAGLDLARSRKPGELAWTLMMLAAWGWVAIGLAYGSRLLRAGGYDMLGGGVILVVAMLACGWVGFALERLAYKPLRKSPRINVLITAIGVSLLLQNSGQLPWMFGTRPVGMPTLIPSATPLVEVGGAKVWLVDVVAGGTAIVLMLLLDRLVFASKLGRAMRAVSYSEKNAALMGIPVDRVVSFTFVLGAALAAAAGFLYAQKYPGVQQTAAPVWVLLGLKAFVAAVVGGIGNVRGAMLGGLLIGLLEFFGVAYARKVMEKIGIHDFPGEQLRDVYVFAALILVLLFKPGGLLGRVTPEKV